MQMGLNGAYFGRSGRIASPTSQKFALGLHQSALQDPGGIVEESDLLPGEQEAVAEEQATEEQQASESHAPAETPFKSASQEDPIKGRGQGAGL